MSMGQIYNTDRLLAEYRTRRKQYLIQSQQQQVDPGIDVELLTVIKALKCYRQHLMDEINIVKVGRKYVPKEKVKRPQYPNTDKVDGD